MLPLEVIAQPLLPELLELRGLAEEVCDFELPQLLGLVDLLRPAKEVEDRELRQLLSLAIGKLNRPALRPS